MAQGRQDVRALVRNCHDVELTTERSAVNFVLNQEEGGERSVPDGDEHAETVLHEFGTVLSVVPGVRDPAVESQVSLCVMQSHRHFADIVPPLV